MKFLINLSKLLPMLALSAFLAGAAAAQAPAQAQAQDYASLLPKLAAKSLSAKLKTINALAVTGDPRAADTLDAMVNSRLYFRKSDKQIFIVEKSGNAYLLTNPLDGKDAGQAKSSELSKVRVNNRLRKAIRGALGGLTLLSKDPAVRSKAADAVFKSRDDNFLETLSKAIERESVPEIKSKMVLARAAIQISNAKDQAVRMTAIKALSNQATPEVRSLLGNIAASESDPKVKEAAAETLSQIESTLAFWNGIGNIFQGLSLGSVLLLAAVGLAITFGVMGVINMAHGELVMLGAYTTFVVQEIIRTSFPALFDYSLAFAIPLAFMVSGLFGIAIERGIIRFLYGRPLETLLATWGLSLILQQFVRSIFGPTNREVGNPSWMSGAVEVTGGLVLTYNRIWIILFSLVVLGLLVLLLKKSAFGLQMRAVTQNRNMASSMGIKTGYVDALTFGLGSGIAGIAGVALSQIDNVSPNLGQSYIIDSFMVVVFGGVGNLWGTLVGAFSLGIINKFMEPFTGTVLAKILVLVAIILFIQKRPRGLFALKGRAVEA
jgi:urea transport system permease protein